jgi:hypothetical protein
MAFNFSAEPFEPSFEPSPELLLAAPLHSPIHTRRTKLSASAQSQPNKKPSPKT